MPINILSDLIFGNFNKPLNYVMYLKKILAVSTKPTRLRTFKLCTYNLGIFLSLLFRSNKVDLKNVKANRYPVKVK